MDVIHSTKTSGYLEKKGSIKVITAWRKYWFVLEGRLLLYYRSKIEYECLSPCKGSINLGPHCSLKPGPPHSCIFQIETRASSSTLKAENQSEQEKWMQAVLSALKHNAISPPLAHFRYSSGDLPTFKRQAQEERAKTATKPPKTPTLVKILRRRSSGSRVSVEVEAEGPATSIFHSTLNGSRNACDFTDLNENSVLSERERTSEPDAAAPARRRSLRFFTLKFSKKRRSSECSGLKRRPSFIKRVLRKKKCRNGEVFEKKHNASETEEVLTTAGLLEEITFAATSDPCKPKLPPKQNHAKTSPYHDRPSSKPIPTINEILDDLDRQKCAESATNEVVMRKKQKRAEETTEGRHSEDLNLLLDQLCKVMNAPILSPGATSSLVSTTVTNDEWSQLLPRRRRHSDPDYDVPRPHSVLIVQAKEEEEEEENVMAATRFFGPVLSYTKSPRSLEESFTPDSLEILDLPPMSYSSHNYNQDGAKGVSRSVCEDERVVIECEDDSLLKDDYIDSLDQFVELKTAF